MWKRRAFFLLWFLSLWAVAHFVSEGWRWEKHSTAFYYALFGALAPLAAARSDAWPFVAGLVGALLYCFLGLLVAWALGRVSAFRNSTDFWRRHRYATLMAPAGGLALLAISLLPQSFAPELLMNLVFLPLRVWIAACEGMPDWARYLSYLFGMPGQYLVVGILVDLLRRTRNPRWDAFALLSAAIFLLTLALYFAGLVKPLYEQSHHAESVECAPVVPVYATLAAVLAVLAVRAWCRGSARRPTSAPPLTGQNDRFRHSKGARNGYDNPGRDDSGSSAQCLPPSEQCR